MKEKLDGRIKALMDRLDEVSLNMEKMKIAEYVSLVQNPRRMVMINFVAGISRGVGIGLGATVVAAIFLYLLGRLASLNLPIIGDFIARIAKIVAEQL